MLALHQNFPYKARLKKCFRYFSVWGGGPHGSHFTSKTIVNVKDLTKTDAIQKNPKNAFQSHANIPFETDGQKESCATIRIFAKLVRNAAKNKWQVLVFFVQVGKKPCFSHSFLPFPCKAAHVRQLMQFSHFFAHFLFLGLSREIRKNDTQKRRELHGLPA